MCHSLCIVLLLQWLHIFNSVLIAELSRRSFESQQVQAQQAQQIDELTVAVRRLEERVEYNQVRFDARERTTDNLLREDVDPLLTRLLQQQSDLEASVHQLTNSMSQHRVSSGASDLAPQALQASTPVDEFEQQLDQEMQQMLPAEEADNPAVAAPTAPLHHATHRSFGAVAQPTAAAAASSFLPSPASFLPSAARPTGPSLPVLPAAAAPPAAARRTRKVCRCVQEGNCCGGDANARCACAKASVGCTEKCGCFNFLRECKNTHSSDDFQKKAAEKRLENIQKAPAAAPSSLSRSTPMHAQPPQTQIPWQQYPPQYPYTPLL
ncbi:MAG: hypothetical protein P4M11_00980, partial [Candidatus Pacebacteria bacterium]|nr:hypothetical protein [Candidatus Paceibacterota bacterium]